jgi:phage FluMu gp28-like protein
MEDAVEMGLVEKINAVSGKNMTREQFIQDCKNRARLPEIYEQAYNCNPQGSASAIVPWLTLQNCCQPREIERVHLEAAQIVEAFGQFQKENAEARRIRIARFIESSFLNTIGANVQRRLGFDVAASGQGDLASIWIDRKEGDRLKLDGLFTCRTDDWDFLKAVLWTFMRRLSAVVGRGDETGLGKQICWETSKQFPNQFEGVNFASKKHDIGHTLMNQLQALEKELPNATEHADIVQDFFAMRKIFSAGRWHFTEGRNTLNSASHCDMAWSGGLASYADANARVLAGMEIITEEDEWS